MLKTKLAYAFVLLAISLFTRLYMLDYPNQTVFDEVHFGKFTNAYCCSQINIFDIHPPHAKYGIAAAVNLFTDYDGQQEFANIGEDYKNVSSFYFRLFPALAGSLIPLAIFFLVLQLGGHLCTGLLAGLAIVFDNGFLVQSRLIALDTQLVLFQLIAILAILKATKATTTQSVILWSSLAGGSAAWAVGSKITGLVAVSIPLLVLFARTFFRANQPKFPVLRSTLWFGSAFCVVYVGGWYFHFAHLDRAGFGDGYYSLTMDFFTDFVQLHKVMVTTNNGIVAPHPYGSSWFSWPFMARGLYYWGRENQAIYFLGNPVVWLGTTIGLVTGTVIFLLSKTSHLSLPTRDKFKDPILWLPAVAFLNAFIPYALVDRGLFLYHYLPPLAFLIVWVCLGLQRIKFIRPGSLLKQGRGFWALGFILIGGFAAMLPLSVAIGAKDYMDAVFEVVKVWR